MSAAYARLVMVLGDNLYDLGGHFVEVLGAVAIAAVPIVLLLLRLHRQGERTYQHLNSVEVTVDPEGEGENTHPTLGQMVRDGFARAESEYQHTHDEFDRNNRDHRAIMGRMDRIEASDDATIKRVERLESQVDTLWAQHRPSRQRPPSIPPMSDGD